MTLAACGSCGACVAHCPVCGRPLETMAAGAVGTVVGCTHCLVVVAYCTACAAFLYPPPAADRRRPCWRCKGRGELAAVLPAIAGPTFALVDGDGRAQIVPCDRCKGSGIDPVGKVEPA